MLVENELLIKTTSGLVFKGNKVTSILDSALSAGLVFEYSCKNGQCGVCKTTLLEGDVVELQPQKSLSDFDRKNKKILSCCCSPDTDVVTDSNDLTALKDIEIKTLPVRINKIEKKGEQIIEVDLRLPPGASFNFLEGQYIDVIGPRAIRRSYSIANNNRHKLLKLFIKRVEGGLFSNYWFDEAKENDLLRIEGPKGTFFLREMEEQIILLATGTGIAPIKSILDKLSESITNLNITLYWGNRKPEEFFWKPNYPNLNLNYRPILSRKDENWGGEIGYVQNAAMNEHKKLENTEVYACGSLAMIESAKKLFIKNGLDEKCFYSDAFVSS